MTVPRETIWNALETVLAATPGLVTCQRRLKAITNVQQQEMPALFIVETFDERKTSGPAGMAVTRKYYANLHIMTYTGDINAPVTTAMNNILDAIDTSLLPVEGLFQNAPTLSGLVTKVTSEGSMHVYEGVDEGYSYVIMPIQVVASV